MSASLAKHKQVLIDRIKGPCSTADRKCAKNKKQSVMLFTKLGLTATFTLAFLLIKTIVYCYSLLGRLAKAVTVHTLFKLKTHFLLIYLYIQKILAGILLLVLFSCNKS